MKRKLALLVAISLITVSLTSCSETASKKAEESSNVTTLVESLVTETTQEVLEEIDTDIELLVFEGNEAETINSFGSLQDADLLGYCEDAVYRDLVLALDSEDYFVESVQASYMSQEYIEELTYNSMENVYFGYTLSELAEVYDEGTAYVFTVDENGETITEEYLGYDDSFERMMTNVAIGSGVILLCITISCVTAPGAPAISMILAGAAETGTTFALSSATIAGVSTTLIEGFQTGNWSEALDSGLLSASEGLKLGAMIGSVAGGVSTYNALSYMTNAGLSLNEAATIQRATGYPAEVIANIRSVEEAQVYMNEPVRQIMVNGRTALIPDIPNYIDDMGRTNLERMAQGLAPIDEFGYSMELHHIGQNNDGPLILLTRAQHDSGVLHINEYSGVDHGASWNNLRQNIYRTLAAELE